MYDFISSASRRMIKIKTYYNKNYCYYTARVILYLVYKENSDVIKINVLIKLFIG